MAIAERSAQRISVLPATVQIATTDLLELLVDANVTDPTRWPECARHGADLLRRIREIEAACIAAHGEFDWQQLDPATQNEYDGNRASLNVLLDDGKPRIKWEDYKREWDAAHSSRDAPKAKVG